jgi:hypothetical protein
LDIAALHKSAHVAKTGIRRLVICLSSPIFKKKIRFAANPNQNVHLHARLRVQWHPVFPTPSVFGAKDFVYDSDASRRETADAYPELAV